MFAGRIGASHCGDKREGGATGNKSTFAKSEIDSGRAETLPNLDIRFQIDANLLCYLLTNLIH